MLPDVRRYRRLVLVSPDYRPSLSDLRHGARLAVRPAAGLCQSLFLASAVLDRSARGSLSHFFRYPPLDPPRTDSLPAPVCDGLRAADASAVSPSPADDVRS